MWKWRSGWCVRIREVMFENICKISIFDNKLSFSNFFRTLLQPFFELFVQLFVKLIVETSVELNVEFFVELSVKLNVEFSVEWSDKTLLWKLLLQTVCRTFQPSRNIFILSWNNPMWIAFNWPCFLGVKAEQFLTFWMKFCFTFSLSETIRLIADSFFVEIQNKSNFIWE